MHQSSQQPREAGIAFVRFAEEKTEALGVGASGHGRSACGPAQMRRVGSGQLRNGVSWHHPWREGKETLLIVNAPLPDASVEQEGP